MNAESFTRLSEREKDVLRLLAEGHEAKSVAMALGLSVHTVNEYLRSARRKLGAANSRSAARQFAAFEQVPDTPENLGHDKSGEAGPRAAGQSGETTARRGVRRGLLIAGAFTMFVILASVLALGTGLMPDISPAQAPAPAVEASATLPAEATASAEAFLKLVDANGWAASHAALSPSVKAQVTAADWENTVAPVRARLGEFLGRTPASGNRTSVLPGLPEGDYGMQQFDARFANHATAVETVVLARESDDWKVIGYFVR